MKNATVFYSCSVFQDKKSRGSPQPVFDVLSQNSEGVVIHANPDEQELLLNWLSDGGSNEVTIFRHNECRIVAEYFFAVDGVTGSPSFFAVDQRVARKPVTKHGTGGKEGARSAA